MSAVEILRKSEGSETILGLPKSHYGKQLSNFDWTAIDPAIPDEIVAFMEEAVSEEAPHLILTGQVGLGKTHIAVGLYRWAVMREGTIRSMFFSALDFFKKVKKTYGDPTAPNPMDDLAEADFFVGIDDALLLGTMRPGEVNIFVEVIKTVYANGAALVLTMNPEIFELGDYVAAHGMDRLLDRSRICEFEGDSWRLNAHGR